jgi:beta-glucosidase
VLAGDMADIATAMDFLGVNYYARSVVGASGHADPVARGCPVTAMGWEIYPEGLTELLLRLHRDYAVPPLVVTENGAAFDDVMVDGGVADLDRAAYLAAHIDAAGEACRQGVPLAGFMAWSLLDNFEWASGYAKRFGIVHVDYATQRRTPKHSAHALRDFLLDQRAHRAQQAAAAPVNDSAALPLGV